MGHTKTRDNVVKKYLGCSVILTIECRHSLSPFSEIVNDHNDVILTNGQGGITSNEFDFPLEEGTNYDHRM